MPNTNRQSLDTSRTLYFAYGSNLDPAQMKRRCPTVETVDPATLYGYRLIFAGASKNWDGGGVATILPPTSESEKPQVPGYLYSLTHDDLQQLDHFEGSYDRKKLEVISKKQPLEAWVYIRRSSEPRTRPNAEYLGIMRSAYQRLNYDLELLERAQNPDPTTE